MLANLAGDETNGAMLMGSVELVISAMGRHPGVVGVQEQALKALGGIAGVCVCGCDVSMLSASFSALCCLLPSLLSL